MEESCVIILLESKWKQLQIKPLDESDKRKLIQSRLSHFGKVITTQHIVCCLHFPLSLQYYQFSLI